MAQIEIQSLHKHYGDTVVLHDIQLRIGEGEFVVLVGPSGCGKSTLLRSIAGLEQADGGTIRFNGQPVDHLPPQQRQVAMVFQNYALYPHMTVRNNMAFGLREQRQPAALIAERIARAAAALHLEPYLDRYPRQLSGGQRQRVAMGRAMVRQPLAFLFDEPLSNLDAQLRVQMRTEIRELQRQLGTTTVYVTHDQEEAMTMADRIVVLRSGRIEQVGTPLELYDRPVNTFVARFIGSPPMNLLLLKWQQGQASVAGQAVPGLERQAESGVRVGAAYLGLRPEHLQLWHSEASLPDSAPRLNIRLQAIDHLGAQTELLGKLENHACAEVSEPVRLLARVNGRHHAMPDDRLTLTWAMPHAHAFDDQGLRLD